MRVVLVYFLTLRMSIFETIMLDDILLTKHHMIKAERMKRCNWISSEITLPRDIHNKSKLTYFKTSLAAS